ncbi:tRNA (N(6)-L-threonylcarbamoyladenosine(37)-C(2))-methylthiotransferase MtaB [PVC group bacterium]|nr:tRNA (N(6)-L-threonylcarbamoyladenosine(37)-C(2))-methylthiotransferase MtaB [PVC group bacterium]
MLQTQSQTKQASVHTLGCRLNQSETALMARQLEHSGYKLVPFGDKADLAIINTCTVTAMADAKSRRAIRFFIKKNPGAYLAVVGCYSQMGYRAIANIPGVDLIIGNQEKLNVLHYVNLGKNKEPVIIRDKFLREDFTIDPIGQAKLNTRVNLKIQDGCDFMCTFCIIPFARGRARSRKLSNILDEAVTLAQQGTREIILTGVNLGTYQSENSTIEPLIHKLNEVPGIQRIRLSSIEPTTIPPGLFKAMNDDTHALLPYLHIPLQSGSNKTLKAMSRKYTREEFEEFISMAQSRVKDICIGTDIMVGFPGETEEDFEDTCCFFKKSPLAYAHVFSYSMRDGTRACGLKGHVSEAIKKARSAKLRHLSEHKRRHYNASFIGQIKPVLFEEKDHEFWLGYTCNFIRVFVKSDKHLKNQIYNVKLSQAAPEGLEGRLCL